MKTAISVPDDLYEQVEKWAGVLNIGRSRFYARAAERYIAELEADSMTAELNAVAELVNADESTRAAVEHSRYMLSRDPEDW